MNKLSGLQFIASEQRLNFLVDDKPYVVHELWGAARRTLQVRRVDETSMPLLGYFECQVETVEHEEWAFHLMPTGILQGRLTRGANDPVFTERWQYRCVHTRAVHDIAVPMGITGTLFPCAHATAFWLSQQE